MAFADRGDLDFIDKAGRSAGRRLRFRRRGRCDSIAIAVRPGFWAGLRRAMGRGAIFAAVEPVPSFFRDLVLGSRCLFRRRRGHAFDGKSVTEADWLETMQGVGFADAQVAGVETLAGAALLMTAEVDIERHRWRGTGTAIIVGDGDASGTQTTSAFATLLASSGLHVSIVLDTETGCRSARRKRRLFIVFFTRDEDLACLAGQEPARPVHAPEAACRLHRQAGDDAMARHVRRGLIGRQAPTMMPLPGSGPSRARLANEVTTLDIRRVDVADGMAAGHAGRTAARSRPVANR